MQLLTDAKLVWSPVVANSKMNRQRIASGINSYEKEIGFKPEEFLRKCIEENGKVEWLDLCCGQGKALVQCGTYLAGLGLQDKARIKGIDLVDGFVPVPVTITCIELEATSLSKWNGKGQYDLITCIHGLHYIGDKLKIIQQSFEALKIDGLFIANLDLDNIRINGSSGAELKNLFKSNELKYNSRKRLLEGRGKKSIAFNLAYRGADDTAGPNFTGQEAVNSYYNI